MRLKLKYQQKDSGPSPPALNRRSASRSGCGVLHESNRGNPQLLTAAAQMKSNVGAKLCRIAVVRSSY